jgi:hypothetical protein
MGVSPLRTRMARTWVRTATATSTSPPSGSRSRTLSTSLQVGTNCLPVLALSVPNPILRITDSVDNSWQLFPAGTSEISAARGRIGTLSSVQIFYIIFGSQSVRKEVKKAVLWIRIQDPGSGAFLTPGSGIRNRFFPDPGSQTHTFESLVTIFWAKSSIILWKLAQIFFFSTSQENFKIQ